MKCISVLTKPKVAMRLTGKTVTRSVRKNKLGAVALAACMQSCGDALSNQDVLASSMLHGASVYITLLISLV